MTLKVEIDWDKNGYSNYTDSYSDDYSDPNDDVTDRIRAGTDTLTVQYGRDQSTALSPTVSGSGGFSLDNTDRALSPRNPLSPLYGRLKPARPVRVTRTIGADTFTLFNGHTDDAPINPDTDSKSVTLPLVDWLADFSGQTISTPLFSGVRTGDAIGYVLDACGWPAALRDLDPGATVIQWWWEDNTDALDALNKLVRSEGPPALLTVGADGSIVFRDRHHRLTRTASVTPQSVWSGEPALTPTMDRQFSYDDAWRNIINTGTKTVDVRSPQGLTQVWSLDATVTLSPGEQRLITASGSDPFYDAETPVAGVDFQLEAGGVAVALTRTSGASAGIVLTATGAATRISGLQLRAKPLPTSYSIEVSAADTQSIDDYNARSFPTDLPWCNQYDAQAILSTAVTLRSQPLPILQVTFSCGEPSQASLVLTRDLSDRVTVLEQETVLSDDFFIESIQHSMSGEFDHAASFGLEAAPATVTPVLRFDTSGQGFDQGLFGNGIDDPATMFRFDSTTGHRFDEGVFAT